MKEGFHFWSWVIGRRTHCNRRLDLRRKFVWTSTEVKHLFWYSFVDLYHHLSPVLCDSKVLVSWRHHRVPVVTVFVLVEILRQDPSMSHNSFCPYICPLRIYHSTYDWISITLTSGPLLWFKSAPRVLSEIPPLLLVRLRSSHSYVNGSLPSSDKNDFIDSPTEFGH